MIRVQGIGKSFGGQSVLKGCDLEIASGETMVIMGQSGAGKSVLLKIIAGLLTQDEGSVTIDGRHRHEMGEEEREDLALRFGYLFQGAALFDSMTVGENVVFALRRHGRHSEKRLRDLAEERLGWVGLKGIQDRNPAELSGGMRKRVGLARAVAMEPSFVLYDEPTTGLDPVTAGAINDLIISLQARLAITSIVVTHDMASVFKVGHRMAMLHQGRIIETGTATSFRRSKNPVIQQFIHGRSKGPISVL
ncbi:MAG: ABC transporter ATP-binding protein [candidate division FCPU426 bacterium]